MGVTVTGSAGFVPPGSSTMRDLPSMPDLPVLPVEAALMKQTFDAVAILPEVSLAFTRRVMVVAVMLGTVQLNVPDLPWF